MARTKISEFSATPNDNTDIDGIDIAEGCAPSGINNAIRELMSQLKDFQTGSAGDPFNGAVNGTVGATTPSTVVATQVDITAQGDLRLQDTTGGQYVALQAPGTVATSYTLTLPVDDGTAGQALITDGSGVLSWSSAASGDVYGPGSATDNAVARYDGTTGKIIQNSAVTIGDDGATVIAANSSSDGLRITQIGAGNALVVEDSANPDATPFVIDASGNAVQGNTTFNSIGTLSIGGFQAQQNSSGAVGTSVISYGTAAAAYARAAFARSPSGTIGTNAAVAINNALMELVAYGHDGTSFVQAATIQANVDGTPGTNDMPGRLVFSTTADGASSPTERMRITSTGAVGIGTSSLSAYGLRVSKTSDGASFVGIGSTGSGSAAATSSVFNFYSVASTASNSGTPYTIPVLRHYDTVQSAFNADSTVTNQIGFHAGSSLTGATNNYGFYGNIASGTGRWNFYAAGTANNYFAGNVGIGITAPSAKLSVVGAIRVGSSDTANYSEFGNNGTSNYWNSITDPIAIFAGGAERVRITNAGIISLGATTGAESLRVTPVASAVNYWNAEGNSTGGGVQLMAQGSDANITAYYQSKGTGSHVFWDNSAAVQFSIVRTASAVNYLQVTGGATGSAPSILAQGSDTNINLKLSSKGGAGVELNPGNQGTPSLVAAYVASPVNYAAVYGSATGNAIQFNALGSDTNIDIALTPKGTGNVRFGTHTASSDVAISGYITIKDSAGNTRKLAVIS